MGAIFQRIAVDSMGLCSGTGRFRALNLPQRRRGSAHRPICEWLVRVTGRLEPDVALDKISTNVTGVYVMSMTECLVCGRAFQGKGRARTDALYRSRHESRLGIACGGGSGDSCSMRIGLELQLSVR